MPKTNDAYGAELWDYYKTKENKREIVERDDKFIDGRRDGYGGHVYFSEYKHWPSIEKKSLKYARGRVLDVGCGAGRHALYLQNKGLQVTGIDTSPLAMKLLGAKLRGIFAKFSEAPPTLLRQGYGGFSSPYPRSKLRGIRRRRIKASPRKTTSPQGPVLCPVKNAQNFNRLLRDLINHDVR